MRTTTSTPTTTPTIEGILADVLAPGPAQAVAARLTEVIDELARQRIEAALGLLHDTSTPAAPAKRGRPRKTAAVPAPVPAAPRPRRKAGMKTTLSAEARAKMSYARSVYHARSRIARGVDTLADRLLAEKDDALKAKLAAATGTPPARRGRKPRQPQAALQEVAGTAPPSPPSPPNGGLNPQLPV